MKFLHLLLMFLFHLGYFGPLVMGVLDSSFLFLPFGNDLLVVALVAEKHQHAWVYVLAAAAGSTVGAALLTLISRKLGAEGLCKVAGERRFNQLKRWIGNRAVLATACGALAPPPFPYTLVVASCGALEYPMWRLMLTNFLARAVRFTILALLAVKFGRNIIDIAQSAPFRWIMIGFISVCLAGSIWSIWNWLHKTRRRRNA